MPPIIHHRAKGLSGPFFQPIGGGLLIKSVGNAHGVGGPLSVLKPLRAEVAPDADHITVRFNRCATLHPLHAGVEYQVDGGAWLGVAGETTAGDADTHIFTLHLAAQPGEEIRWRYVPGDASPGLVDCDDGIEMGAAEIPVYNGLELAGNYILLETGGVKVILVEDATVDPDDGINLEVAP